MKLRLILLLTLFISYFQVTAHDKITIRTKESFNAAREGKHHTTFDLIEVEDKNTLKEANRFIKDNAAYMSATLEGNIVHLDISSAQAQKVVYQKLFHLLGLQEIEILEGDAKGIYSVDEFLNLYEF